MQICTSSHTDMPAPHHSVFLQSRCHSYRPTDTIKTLKLLALNNAENHPFLCRYLLQHSEQLYDCYKVFRDLVNIGCPLLKYAAIPKGLEVKGVDKLEWPLAVVGITSNCMGLQAQACLRVSTNSMHSDSVSYCYKFSSSKVMRVVIVQHCIHIFSSRVEYLQLLFTDILPPLLHPFNGLFSSRHQKGKPFWILMKQEMMEWQWHQLDHMQIVCTSLQTDNHASTSPLCFYRPDTLSATQPTTSKH